MVRVLLGLALVLLSRAQDDGDEDDTARLLVRKTYSDKRLVLGRNVTVQYTVFNLGELEAYDIELTHGANEVLTVVGPKTLWAKELEAGGKLVLETMVSPNALAEKGFEDVPAAYKYKYNNQGKVSAVKGFTTTVRSPREVSREGKVPIISPDEYARLNSTFLLERTVFFLLQCLILGLPAFALSLVSPQQMQLKEKGAAPLSDPVAAAAGMCWAIKRTAGLD